MSKELTGPTAASHYDGAYFDWQRQCGRFGGWADLPKFLPHLNSTDAVLDFGCGGGYLLRALPHTDKCGLEINPAARSEATEAGLRVFASVDEIPLARFDVIISNHALEHCRRPFDEIIALKTKLRPGGRMLFYVPTETSARAYRPNNQDRHLYTWSPLNLGNLFAEAGMEVVFARAYHHRWPPHYASIRRVFGDRGFHLAAVVYGHLTKGTVSQCCCLAAL